MAGSLEDVDGQPTQLCSKPPEGKIMTTAAHAAVTHRTVGTAARAQAVTKRYGQGETSVVALDQVDVDIERGRFTAIMGPSGLRQVHADALPGRPGLGQRGQDLDSATARDSPRMKDKELTKLRRDRIGFIFQSFNLLPTLNAAENITLPMDIAGRKAEQGVAGPGDRHRRAGVPAQAPPQPALRRPAAARRRGPRPGRPAGDHLRRRAHRQPGLPRPAPRCWASCGARWTSWARPSSWSPTTRARPPTPTACCSWPTAGSSTR